MKLAQGLNLMETTTSFHLSEHDLRKALGMLAAVWIDGSAHPAERLRLPAYAKAHGFPQHLPVLDGVDAKEVPKRLYDIARAMDVIERAGPEGEAPRVLVRYPADFSKITSKVSRVEVDRWPNGSTRSHRRGLSIMNSSSGDFMIETFTSGKER